MSNVDLHKGSKVAAYEVSRVSTLFNRSYDFGWILQIWVLGVLLGLGLNSFIVANTCAGDSLCV